MTKDLDPPEGAVKPENLLDFNDVLKVPVINYDAAGHISDLTSATHF
jgi:hypothetical protein